MQTTQRFLQPATLAMSRSLAACVSQGFKRTSASHKLKQRAKYYSSHPEKFRLTGRIRNIDLSQPNLTFPLNIPLKMKYSYIPQKHQPHVPTHDFMNFKAMTGNEILLNLENYLHLRPSEICAALIELSKREGSAEINWNEHAWIKQTVEHVIKMLPTYTPSVVNFMLLGFQRLHVKDAALWEAMTVSVEKTIHKFNAKAFAFTYIAYMEDPTRSTEEFRKKLVELLPVHLHQMSPLQMTECFDITFQRGYLNEYLFEQHFHVLYWRRNVWFGADNLIKALNVYLKRNFNDDCEFFQNAILANLPKIKSQLNETNTQQLLDIVNAAEQAYPDLKVNSTLKFLNNHLTFCQTKLKAIENAKFYNIVLNDFEYYRIKETKNLQRQAEN